MHTVRIESVCRAIINRFVSSIYADSQSIYACASVFGGVILDSLLECLNVCRDGGGCVSGDVSARALRIGVTIHYQWNADETYLGLITGTTKQVGFLTHSTFLNPFHYQWNADETYHPPAPRAFFGLYTPASVAALVPFAGLYTPASVAAFVPTLITDFAEWLVACAVGGWNAFSGAAHC